MILTNFIGPLIYDNHGLAELIGVVSWGAGCGIAGKPGVYARVDAVLPWLNKFIDLYP